MDMQQAQKDPSSVFSSPDELAIHPELTKSQKLKLLGVWKEDAIQLQRAAGERMTGGEDDRLREVEIAMARVEDEPD